jgi:hypothetical protein
MKWDLAYRKQKNFGAATTKDEIAGGVEERSFNVSNLRSGMGGEEKRENKDSFAEVNSNSSDLIKHIFSFSLL